MRLLLLVLVLALSGCPAPADSQDNAARVEEMYARYRTEDFPEVADIAPTTLVSLMRQTDVVLVDVREPSEQAVSMLPGAIPAEKFQKDPGRYRGRVVVAYCTISYRSGELLEELAEEGALHGMEAVNLRGGMLGWAHAGYVFQTPDGLPTKTMHVYGSKWNLLPPGYEGVW